MRIAFLNPQGNFDAGDFGWAQHPDFGGQLVYLKELSLALGELGHRVDIVTRRVEDPAWPPFAGSEDRYPGQENVRILRFDCGPRGFLPKERLWPHLREWTRQISGHYQGSGGFPDILGGHYGDGGLAAVLIEETYGVRYTFTAHSLGAQKMDKTVSRPERFDELCERFRFDRRIAAERLAMARAGRIITSTDQERVVQYGHRLYRGAIDPAQSGRFAVIPPGVNLRVFAPDAGGLAAAVVAERFARMLRRDIAPDRRELPLVICSSRLEEKKNHLGLLKAWTRSVRLRSAANLLIVTRGVPDPLKDWQRAFRDGERRLFGRLVEEVEEGGLAGCVGAVDLNNQEELAAAYRLLAERPGNVFALTAAYEPFGLAPLEAAAVGLPVVVTVNGGPSETFRDAEGEYGVLVDPEDPADIARGLLELIGDEGRWREMQTRARQRVEKRYTWRRCAEGYLSVFGELLESRAAGAPGTPAAQVSLPPWFFDPVSGEAGRRWLRRLYYGDGIRAQDPRGERGEQKGDGQ